MAKSKIIVQAEKSTHFTYQNKLVEWITSLINYPWYTPGSYRFLISYAVHKYVQ